MAAPRRVPNAPHGADQTRRLLHFGCAAVARTVSPHATGVQHLLMTVDAMTTQRLSSHSSRLVAGAALFIGAAVGGFGSADATTTADASSGRLTYAMWIGENPEIFVAAADGAEEVQLTADPNRDLCPAFAPDGTAIVFCSDRSGAFEIWMMNSDGTDQRQITRTGGRMLFPKVSPDGTAIAFSGALTADAPDEESDIWLVDVDGTGLTQLTSAPGSDAYVTWSPDGEHIAWVSYRSGTSEIWVMNADGTNPRALTADGTPKDQLPDWSPDGSLIAYAAGGDIVVMNSDGTDPHTITTDPADDFGPAWSPDSTQIAFVSTRDDPQQHYVIDVDGTDEHKLPTDGRVAVPDWSGAGSGTAGPQAIDLGGAAWSTVYGFGGTWIQVDPPVDQLVKVDAETGTVTMTVDGGTAAAIGTDAVWVTVGGQETQKIDPETGEVLLTVTTPSAFYVAVGAGSVWVPTTDGVARIDPDTGDIVATIPIAGDMTDLAADDAGVWVTDKGAGLVRRIDPATNVVVAEIPTGAGAHDLAIDGSGVWVTNYSDGTVSRIDAATNEVVATIEGVGSGVGIDAGGDAIWVSTQGLGISRIDPETNEVVRVAELDGWSYGVAYGDGELWVSSVDHELVNRIPLDGINAG